MVPEWPSPRTMPSPPAVATCKRRSHTPRPLGEPGLSDRLTTRCSQGNGGLPVSAAGISGLALPRGLPTRCGSISRGRTLRASLSINYRTPEEVMAEAEPVIRICF
jgi:hypothetical protein